MSSPSQIPVYVLFYPAVDRDGNPKTTVGVSSLAVALRELAYETYWLKDVYYELDAALEEIKSAFEARVHEDMEFNASDLTAAQHKISLEMNAQTYLYEIASGKKLDLRISTLGDVTVI